MRIITVNIPENYLKIIKSLVGNKAFYPSRSELFRAAIREFLLNEMEAAKSFAEQNQNDFLQEQEKKQILKMDPTPPSEELSMHDFYKSQEKGNVSNVKEPFEIVYTSDGTKVKVYRRAI